MRDGINVLHALARPPEQAQDLRRAIVGAAEPVRESGVELDGVPYAEQEFLALPASMWVDSGRAMFLPVTYVYTESGYANYVAVLAVHLYSDPGTRVYVDPHSPTGTVGTAFCSVSGYLV